MVVTGLGLLLGGRADPGAVRAGADRRRRRGPAAGRRPRGDGPVGRARRATAGGRARTTASCWSPGTLDRGRPLPGLPRRRAGAGRRARRAGRRPGRGPRPVRPARGCRSRPAARAARPRSPATGAGRPAGALPRPLRPSTAGRRRELDGADPGAATRAQEADLLRFGLEEIERVDPSRARTWRSRPRSDRLAHADDLRRAADDGARPRCSGDDDGSAGAATPSLLVGGPRGRARAVARPRPRAGRARRPAGRGRPTCSPTSPPTSRATPDTVDGRPGPAGSGAGAPGRADRADPQVRRPTVREVLTWAAARRGPAGRAGGRRRPDRASSPRAPAELRGRAAPSSPAG